MKYSNKSLSFIISLIIISSPIVGLNSVVMAATTATPVADKAAPIGLVTKLMVTFNGDSTKSKGFTWYTSTASVNSDLQIVEKNACPADFTKGKRFVGTSAVPSNNTVATPPAGTTTSKAEFLHKAEAINLKANTTYYYRVGDADLGLWSDVSTFQTAPSKGGFTFLDLADPQAKDYSEGLLAASTFTKALDIVPNAKFIDLNGDIVDDGSVEYEWDWLFNNIGQKFLNTTVAPIAGNHDDKSLGGFSDHFDLSPAPKSATATGVYYSYDYSNAHFVMLNCNECDDPTLPSFNTDNNISQAQIDWLKSDVANARAKGQKWIVVTLHKGPYSTSNHATDSDLAGPTGARKKLAPIFAQLGIDLVLQGHDHIYARSKPINSDSRAVPENLVTGSFQGQKLNYEVNPGAPVYLIPATAGPKVYYKNQSIVSDPTAIGYDPSYYSLFDVADENHAAKYGPDPSDVTRPLRSQIQNFESITINNDKLSVISYEIDQNKKDAMGVAQPYVIDTFGIVKSKVQKSVKVIRSEASLALAKKQFASKKPNAVVLASVDNLRSTLVVLGVDHKYKAPLLLVNTVNDSQLVLEYITANLSIDKNIYVLGKSGEISKEITDYLTTRGYNINILTDSKYCK